MSFGRPDPKTEAGHKYLVVPISATVAKICDHNGLSFRYDAHAAAVSWAYANLDSERNTYWYKQKIKLACLKFPFNLEDEIKPSNNSLLDAEVAACRVNNGVNKGFWKWDETSEGTPLYNAEVVGGWWFGNRTQQNAGHGFFVKNLTGVNNYTFIGRDITFGSLDEDGIHLELINSQRFRLHNNWTSGVDQPPEGIGNRGLYIRSAGDGTIRGGGYQGSHEGAYLDLIGDLVIAGVYFGGGAASAPTGYQVYLRGCKRTSIVGGTCILDGDKNGLGIIRSGVGFETFGVRVTDSVIASDNLDTDSTYSAVRLLDETRNCTIKDNYIGYKNPDPGGANYYLYGIEEFGAGCDYNEIGPNNYYMCDINTLLVGPNSNVYPKHQYYENVLFPAWLPGTNMTMAIARCYTRPFEIRERVSVDRIAVALGGTVAGNIRVGIYYDNGNTPVGGALVVESASIAKTGTNRMQEVTIASTILEPGKYWAVIQSDEATTVFIRDNSRYATGGTRVTQYYDRGGGYGAFTDPYPATTINALSMWAGYLRVA